jgi:Tfp pilus assembly protein PilV
MLLEVLVAIFVFGLVGAAVLSGMSATAMSGRAYEVSSNIENIARNQMEHMNSLPYVEPGNSYHTIAVPEGYAVTCEATEYVAGNPAIEKVVVTVSVEGTVRLVVSTIRTR